MKVVPFCRWHFLVKNIIVVIVVVVDAAAAAAVRRFSRQIFHFLGRNHFRQAFRGTKRPERVLKVRVWVGDRDWLWLRRGRLPGKNGPRWRRDLVGGGLDSPRRTRHSSSLEDVIVDVVRIHDADLRT
jgi:hypothetical protein